MPTYGPDNYEVCRVHFRDTDYQYDYLTHCQGGPQDGSRYAQGDNFWDDELADDISYAHAMQRAPFIYADVGDPSLPPGGDVPPQIPEPVPNYPPQPEPVPPSIPPELAGILTGLRDLVGDVETELQQVTNPLLQRASATISRVESSVAGVAQPILDRVSAVELTISADLGEAVNNIRQGIADSISGVIQTIDDEAATILRGLEDTIQALVPTLSEALLDEGQRITEMGQAIADTALKPEDLWNWLFGVFSENWHRIADPATEIGTSVIGAGFEALMHSLEQESSEGLDSVIGRVLNVEGLPDETRRVFEAMANKQHPFWFIALEVLAAVALIPAVAETMKPQFDVLRQRLNALNQQNVIGPSEAAEAFSRGIIGADAWREITAKHGLPPDQATIEVSLAKELLSPGEIVAARLRGYIDHQRMLDALARRGILPDDAALLYQLATEVPSPGDLVTFLRREVFTPQISQPYGHYLEYPDQADPVTGLTADDWFAKQGFDHNVALLYWAAHWDVPSAGQGFEMFQRGIISDDDLRLLLRANNIVPGWRDKLIQLNYHPLTRVDVRRMHKTQVLTDDDLVRAYQNVGYSPEDAARLADFTKRLNSQETQNELEPFRSTFRGRLTSAYINGTLGADVLSQGLVALGYTDGQVEAFVAEAEFTLASERAETVRANVKRLYVKGFWTREQSADRLRAALLDESQVGFLLDGWDLEREFNVDSEAKSAERDLTVSDIIGAYKDRIITRDIAFPMVQSLGYDEQETELKLARADFDLVRDEIKAEQERIRALLLANRIDRAEAGTELDALNLSPRQREALLTRWETERDSKVPELSRSELADMVRREIMTEDEAREHLRRQGFAEVTTERLLALWGGREAEREAREARIERDRKESEERRAEAEDRRKVAEERAAAERARVVASRSDVQDLVEAREAGTITRSQLVQSMRALGIDLDAITRIVNDSDKRLEDAAKR